MVPQPANRVRGPAQQFDLLRWWAAPRPGGRDGPATDATKFMSVEQPAMRQKPSTRTSGDAALHHRGRIPMRSPPAAACGTPVLSYARCRHSAARVPRNARQLQRLRSLWRPRFLGSPTATIVNPRKRRSHIHPRGHYRASSQEELRSTISESTIRSGSELTALGLAPAGLPKKGQCVYGMVETSSERRQTQQNCPSKIMRPSAKT
jgi:hypothetical protein